MMRYSVSLPSFNRLTARPCCRNPLLLVQLHLLQRLFTDTLYLYIPQLQMRFPQIRKLVACQ